MPVVRFFVGALLTLFLGYVLAAFYHSNGDITTWKPVTRGIIVGFALISGILASDSKES